MGDKLLHHPAADLFPMMAEAELAALADDVREHGLKVPILLDAEGRVVDGRNRFAACERAGVEPSFENMNGGDPLAEVLSRNVRRRKMLTVGQLAIAAAESWPLVGGKPERGSAGRNRSAAAADLTTFPEMAKRWEVSDKSLERATALVERDPDAAAQVKAGLIQLEAAYEALLGRERDAKKYEASLDGLRERHSDLAEQVATGALSLTEANAAGSVRDREAREERQAFTAVLFTIASSAMPVEHAKAYAESYDPQFDPIGKVKPEALEAAARFAEAVAQQLRKETVE
jgi:hypothetical protein